MSLQTDLSKKLLSAVERLAHAKGIGSREALAMTCRTTVAVLNLIFREAKSGGADPFGVAALPSFSFEFDLNDGDCGDFDKASMEAAEAYVDAVRHTEPFADILSDLHMHLSGGGRLAQQFTPRGLAMGMSRFLEVAQREAHSTDMTSMLSIADPTCGAGGLLLAQIAARLKVDGPTVIERLHVEGNDIDPLCALMTSTQIFSNELIHGTVLGAVQVTVGNVITEYGVGAVFHQSVRTDTFQQKACTELLRRTLARPRLPRA